MPESLKSRKFWLTLIAMLLCGCNAAFGSPIPEGSLEELVKVVMAYVLGQGAVDLSSEFAAAKDLGVAVAEVAQEGKEEGEE